MRITIIGSGYVGLALARHWRREGQHQISLTTTRAARLESLHGQADHVLLARADDPDQLLQALEGAEVAVFCQAPRGDRLVGPVVYRATYCDPFVALQGLLPALPDLRQIVYTGSGSLYGDTGGAWVDEDTPPQPRDGHGEVLLEAEQLLSACRSPQRRVCVLRFGALYGPGRDLLRRLSPLAGTTRAGRGQEHCSWLHLDDAVGALAAAVANGWDQTVNVVDDEPCTVARLMARLTEATGQDPVCWQPHLEDPAPRPDRRVSNRRLHQLGYQLQHPRVEFPRLVRLDDALLAAVSARAAASERGRINHNLHRHADAVQRFLNALQPGTYVRPHRHVRQSPGEGFECFVVLQGSIGLLVFAADGTVIHSQRLQAGGPVHGVELAEDQFHSLVALSDDAVLLELKQGPYRPTEDKDFLACFPAEGTEQAAEQERCWRALFAEGG
ncbi:MAG: WbuC family cupin fold metalloprotein [Cyanobacteria bacterium REEB498]|nr:WbuC family cupin fold metalloprotein [Cyanobacteria bacterium REEB498]